MSLLDFLLLMLPWVALVIGPPVIAGAIVIVILVKGYARRSTDRTKRRSWLLVLVAVLVVLSILWLLLVWPLVHAIIYDPGEFLP